MPTNEQIREKNIKRATEQVEYWKKESGRLQERLAELKAEIDATLAQGATVAGHMAEASEYLDDLQKAETDG